MASHKFFLEQVGTEKKKKALPLCPMYEKRRQRRVQSMQVTRDLWKPQPLPIFGGITLGPGLLPTLPNAEHGPETATHFLAGEGKGGGSKEQSC